MLGPEIIITSHKEEEEWNCGVWSVHQNSPILTFGVGSIRPRCLAMIGSDYLVCGLNDADVLKILPINLPDGERIVINCPSAVTALGVSDDGKYCAGAMESKIYFWKVATGKLMCILSKHWDPVTCLKFSCDGLYLISGGNDRLVMAWELSSILSPNISKKLEPHYIWTDHLNPIVDIYVNSFLQRPKVVTISKTLCKVYSLLDGECTTTFATKYFLFSVAMELTESYIFFGSSTGDIIQFGINKHPEELLSCQEDKGESKISIPRVATFNLHKSAITCLSMSEVGELLLTGSSDGTAVLWDIHAQNVRQIFKLSGIVSNAFFTPCPPSYASNERLPSKTTVKPFKFCISPSDDDDEKEWKLNLSPCELQTLNNIDEDEEIPRIDKSDQGTPGKKSSDASMLTYLMNFTSQESLQNVASEKMY